MKNPADIAIRIAADFVGLPAFKKADTAVDKLYKSTKKLAGAFGVAFSAQAIARYGETAVRAFAAEERQIASLTATVNNLGIAFTAPALNDYIEGLERTTGLVREELQPAFHKLLTQTGSITKSQEILNTAIEVSFSGLMSVGQAADILTKAYVGNTKGLRQLNLGLTTAEISAMSFEQILAKVSDTYQNQFNAAQDATLTKLNKLNIALGNATENIGEGLVGAFAKLAGGGDLDRALAKIEDFSAALGNVMKNANAFELIRNYLNPATAIPSMFRSATGAKPTVSASFGSPAQWRKQSAALIKAETDARNKALKAEQARLATLRKQTAEKRAQTALDKASAALSKSKEMFDLEGIQIQAALQGKISDVDRARLETMKLIYDLEKAIEQNNISLIEKLTAQLNAQVKQTQELNNQSTALKLIQDLLARIGYDRSLFDLSNISQAMALLNQMSGLQYTPSQFATVPNLPQIYDIMINSLPNAAAEEVVVQVNVTESAKKLVDIIMETVTEQSASGNPPFVGRVGESFAW